MRIDRISGHTFFLCPTGNLVSGLTIYSVIGLSPAGYPLLIAGYSTDIYTNLYLKGYPGSGRILGQVYDKLSFYVCGFDRIFSWTKAEYTDTLISGTCQEATIKWENHRGPTKAMTGPDKFLCGFFNKGNACPLSIKSTEEPTKAINGPGWFLKTIQWFCAFSSYQNFFKQIYIIIVMFLN